MTSAFVPDDDPDARIVAAALEVIAAQSGQAPPHDVRVSVGKGGSRVTAGGRHVAIRRRDVGAPWMGGTLGHEYGHVIDWPDHRRRIRSCAVLLPVVAIASAAAVVLLHDQQAIGLALLATFFVAYALGCFAILRGGEYRADAIAAELLGHERVHELFAMFDDIAENRNPPATWWAPHPAPPQRAAAVREQLQRSA